MPVFIAYLTYHIQVTFRSTSPDTTTVSHARPYINLQRYRKTSGERNFIEQTRAQIFLETILAMIMLEPRQNLEKKDTPSILKDHFFQGHTHFHFNSTSVVRLVRRNQLSFSSFEINKERRVGQIQVQKLAVLVTINQMPDNIKNREYYDQYRKQYYQFYHPEGQ